MPYPKTISSLCAVAAVSLSLLPWAVVGFGNRLGGEAFYYVAGMAGLLSIVLTAPLSLISLRLVKQQPEELRFWLICAPSIAFQATYLSAGILPFIILLVPMGNLCALTFWSLLYYGLMRFTRETAGA